MFQKRSQYPDQILFDSMVFLPFSFQINQVINDQNSWIEQKFRKFTTKACKSQERITCGRTLSTTSTSLENLLIILPIGVVSNICRGHFITLSSIERCISLAAYKVPKATVMDATKCEITAVIQKFMLIFVFPIEGLLDNFFS